MYVELRIGDRLPLVALAQARLIELGANIEADGTFGRLTRDAVIALQQRHALPPSGRIGPDTWALLTVSPPLVAVDHIDATDITVLEMDGPYLQDGHATVHTTYGTSRGVRMLIARLVSAHAPASVSLLRFHGHGGPGHMVVSGGRQAATSTTLLGEHFRHQVPVAMATYAQLGRIMKPYGSIELHGCNVASRANGQHLLAGLASLLGVPVVAGRQSQSGGRRASRFEGPTMVRCPNGVSLREWSATVFSSCEW